MRLFSFLSLFLLFFSINALSTSFSLPEESDQELSTIKNLINITTDNLKNQRALLENLTLYKKKHLLFNEDSKNKEKAQDLVKQALITINLINNHHLDHFFSSNFLKELQFFSQFSSPTQIVSP